MNSVRIFVSSPGDVAEERERALVVVKRLQKEFAETLALEPLLWEQEPLLATADFQSQIRSPSESDIFAAIIGGRLGSPLGDQFTRGDGSRYASGTEFEFEVAVNNHHAKGKPELLVYRKMSAQPTDSPDSQAVSSFFEKWFVNAEDRTAIGAYHKFAETEQFEDLFTLHLRKLLSRYLPRPHNLPTPISSFVGRKEILSDVSAMIKQEDVHMVTLFGPGGVGKSRLGLRLAHGLLPEFDDGVFFMPLAALRQSDLVLGTIASVLDIKQMDERPMIDCVTDALANREILLILDNFEQVHSAVKDISAILTKCPNVKALVTSRESLRVSGARNVHVPPFALPDPKRANFASIRESESVQLFVERARIVRGDFELTEDNAQSVLQICHQLDGLPLAIELATSRLRSMDIKKLLRSMEKRFAVLKGGADDLHDHQRSLNELISWSYDLLSEDEQTLWRRMAVFTGGFAMEAAELVCDPEENFNVDIEVEGLADKSLATISFVTNAEEEEQSRVTMLGTLREYALKKLEEAGETEDVFERFCDWAVELAEVYQRERNGSQWPRHISMLDFEYNNLQAGIDYCLNKSEQDLARALRIASGLWWFWFERGFLSNSRNILALAEKDVPGLEPGTRAQALRGLGTIARFQNDLQTAERVCEQALKLHDQIDDPAGRGNVLGELGAIAVRQSDLGKAEACLDEAMVCFEQCPEDLHGRSFVAATRGVVNHLQGDMEGAREFYELALQIGSEHGDSDSIASALVNLGELAELDGDYTAARDHYMRSLKLFAERGKKVAIAYCAEIIAGFNMRHGNKASDAALMLGFAEAVRKEIESPIEPFNERRLNEDTQAAMAAMTPETFQASWNAGTTLDVDEFMVMLKDLELSK